MRETLQSRLTRPSAFFSQSMSITDEGLVCGAGSALVRMASIGGGKTRLRLENDAGRLVAMLSAAFARRIAGEEIIPHVQAAAGSWARGDKAVANFRLIFARLPQLRDQADANRLRLAEYVLDQGFSPDALMKELGFSTPATGLWKYREDQPRVPAGFGDQSGRWTDDPSFDGSQEAPIRVAEGLPEEDEKTYEARHLTGATSRHEDLEHGDGEILREPRLPAGIGPGPYVGEPPPEPIPAMSGKRPGAAAQQQLNENGRKFGCHTCGATDPGTSDGDFIGDHQPPTA